MASNVEILLKATDKASKALQDIEKELKNLDGASKGGKTNVAGFSDTLKNLGKAAVPVAAALAGVGLAANKIYDIGKAGAEIEYASLKFDRLSESVGTTSDVLLNDLTEATGGMFSQAELMASAGDFMALGLAKTHDEAVRLSSVAGQLGMNMNQLVLTLTNQTTMRFDALGVSVDGFDEKVKALEETGMSASEAFNEAFLQQAEEQIEKVGSVADTTLGKFKVFEAALKDFTDSFKKWVAQGILPAVEGFTDFFGVLDVGYKLMQAGEMNLADMNLEMYRSVMAGKSMEQMEEELNFQLREHNRQIDNIDEAMSGHINTRWEMQRVTEEVIPTEEDLKKAEEDAAKAAEELAEKEREVAAAMQAVRDAAGDQIQAIESLASAMDEWDAEMQYRQIKEAADEWYASGQITLPGYEKLLKDAGSELGIFTAEHWEEAAALKWLEDSYVTIGGKLTDYGAAQTLVKDAVSDASWTVGELADQLGEAGFLADTSAAQTKAMEGVMNQLDLDPAIESANSLAGPLLAISGVPAYQKKQIDVNTTYTQTGTAGTGSLYGFGGAAGADFVVPPGYHNDSFPIYAQSGERVQITPAPGGGGDSGGSDMTGLLMQLEGILTRSFTAALVKRDA